MKEEDKDEDEEKKVGDVSETNYSDLDNVPDPRSPKAMRINTDASQLSQQTREYMKVEEEDEFEW